MSPLAPGGPPGDRPEASRTGPPGADEERWARVHERFNEALELDPDAREPFLASLAAADPGLAAEVRSLLAAHERSGEFLSRSPTLPIPQTAASGDRLGPYRLIEEIGHGGMGVVHRATRDDGDFTREVAIKLISPGVRSDDILKRFRAERQILAMLDHPHIARLLDGGTAPDGGPYLVMEYVRGRSLVDYCDEHHLGVDARIDLFLKVCDAVQFAHQRLVVHRDLKADNILVTEDGSPRLLDFGIAKLLAPEGGPSAATVTAPMNRMLTPDYASPEQIRGEPAAVSSDVYSLGVILYELLTGSRPLRFTTRSPEEVLRVITQEDPLPPSTAVARGPAQAALQRGETTTRLRRRLAGDLDYVVLKALEKDPARRYGSVDQLAQDVRRHLDGLPVLARGQSTTYLLSRFVRRHRAAVITTAVVILALIAGLAGTTWQASVARRERDRANRRFNDVRALAHAVVFDIHDAIVNLPGSTKARETLVRHALRYLDDLSREAKDDVGLQYEMGMAYAKIGDVQGRPMFPNLGQSAPALESYRKSLGLLGSVTQAWPDSTRPARDYVVTTQRMADLLRMMGRSEEAMALAVEAKRRIVEAAARHPQDTLLTRDHGVACDRLTDMKLAAGDTAGALAEYREGLDVIQPLFRRDPRDPLSRRAILISTTKLAVILAARGEPDSALGCYRLAERLAEEAVRALPDNTDASRDLSIVYGFHGLFLADLGRMDSAVVVYGRGMRISEELAAKDPDNTLQQADVATGHYDIGTMLRKRGKPREAVPEFTDAYQRFARLAAADTASAEMQINAARSCRGAGEACRDLATRGPAAERSRWRTEATVWLQRSLDRYRPLARAGRLDEEDVAAPKEVAAMLDALR